MYYCFCSIDATNDTTRLARYVNDSLPKYANCRTKAMYVNNRPHVILFASKAIEAGTELRYDYGSGANLEWRKVSF